MSAPFNRFMSDVMDKAVVERYADGSKRVWLGDVPLGGKVQGRGPRCPEDAHDFVLDSYEGIRGTYVDKVCTKCTRRKPFKTQVAATYRKSTR